VIISKNPIVRQESISSRRVRSPRYSCFTSLDVCNCCNPPLLTYIRLHVLYSYFSWSVWVCVRRLTGLVESVQQSEGLRRDGAAGETTAEQLRRAESAGPAGAPDALRHSPHLRGGPSGALRRCGARHARMLQHANMPCSRGQLLKHRDASCFSRRFASRCPLLRGQLVKHLAAEGSW
jgi:hypothetical protein